MSFKVGSFLVQSFKAVSFQVQSYLVGSFEFRRESARVVLGAGREFLSQRWQTCLPH